MTHQLGANYIAAPRDHFQNARREIALVQRLYQHPSLERAQLARLNDDRTTGGDGRSELQANEQRIRGQGGNQTSNTDRLQRDRGLAPAARQWKFPERLLGGLKRADVRLYDDPGELNDASVFLD